MSKKSEDSLENFFRKAASQHDSGLMEKDWRQMEKMLDERTAALAVARRAKLKRVTKYAATIAVVSSSLMIYFTGIDQDRPLVGPDDSLQQQQVAAGSDAPTQDDRKNKPTAGLLPSFTPPAAPPFRAGRETVSNEAAIKANPDGVPVTSTRANPALQDDNQESPDPERAGEFLSALPTASNEAGHQDGNAARQANNDTAEKNENQVESVEETPLPSAEKSGKNSETGRPDDRAFAPRWSAAVVLAPDFSTTALNGYTAPGGAFGVMVGYRVSRFTFNTGVLKSSKKYEGYGSEYKPPVGYWKHRTNGVVPDEIYGTCKVIEVPLIIQYAIRDRERSRAYVAAGMSTYLMLDEQYTYEFKNPNPGADGGWSSNGTTSYPWAIGHFSVGYERKINTRLNIGLEPFLKVPLGAIGWSGIELFTTGAYVNFRYSIAKRSSISVQE